MSGTAIYTDQFNAGGPLSAVTIDSNRFSRNSNVGVLLGSTMAGTQTNIAVSNNAFDHNGNSFVAFNLSGSSFTRNVSTDSLGSSLVVGGGVTGLTISENSVSGGPRSVRVGDLGGGAANSGVSATCNSLTGASTAGLEVDAAGYSGSLPATLDWWGSSTGPTTASNPGGTGTNLVDAGSHVSFTPFLTDGTDSDPGTPGFQCVPKASVADVAASEGNGGTSAFGFTVTLNTSPVTVSYATANGTAEAGADYQATSGTLLFAPGERTKTVSVPVVGDTADEPDETFRLTLSSPSGAGATIADGDATGTIVDDDPAIDRRAPIFRILASRLPKLANALNHGLGVKLTTDEAGTATIVAQVSGRTARGLTAASGAKVVVVARGKRSLRAPGTQRVVVMFTRQAKKRFKRLRKLQLKLVVRISDAAGNTATKTRKVTLKR